MRKWPGVAPPPMDQLKYGGIIGQVTLTTVLLPDDMVTDAHTDDRDDLWYLGDYGFVFTNPQPLPFIPCRGQLYLWDVPEDIMTKVRKAHGH